MFGRLFSKIWAGILEIKGTKIFARLATDFTPLYSTSSSLIPSGDIPEDGEEAVENVTLLIPVK